MNKLSLNIEFKKETKKKWWKLFGNQQREIILKLSCTDENGNLIINRFANVVDPVTGKKEYRLYEGDTLSINNFEYEPEVLP